MCSFVSWTAVHSPTLPIHIPPVYCLPYIRLQKMPNQYIFTLKMTTAMSAGTLHNFQHSMCIISESWSFAMHNKVLVQYWNTQLHHVPINIKNSEMKFPNTFIHRRVCNHSLCEMHFTKVLLLKTLYLSWFCVVLLLLDSILAHVKSVSCLAWERAHKAISHSHKGILCVDFQ
jgi:hypothetical protein